jgi:hypothetical protein
MIAANHANLEECAICDQTVEFGPNRYEGAPLSGYEIFACYICINNHREGFGPNLFAKIGRLLDENGMAHPVRNHKGWLPLEF